MVHWKTITAIGAILVLESIALFQGNNGTQFTLAIAAIAGLGGYHFRQIKENLTNQQQAHETFK